MKYTKYMKLGNLTNLFILFFILIVLGLLYRRFEDKRMREENKDNYNKPIFWTYNLIW